jgi:hypothetical protein
MPTNSVIILYYQNRFALLSALEYTRLVLNLSEKARKKVLAKTQHLERELAQDLALSRAP